MEKIILFIVAILPVAIILTYINVKDEHKEPINLLIKLFIGGIFSCFLVLFVSSMIKPFLPFMQLDLTKPNNFIDVFLYSFVGVALIEELCKFLMTYLIGYKNENFDEVYDIIVYSVFVSLGFACFENILYVMDSGLKIGISRALLAVPGHACDGLFMGYFLCLAKIYNIKENKNKEIEYIIKGILIAVTLHGIYDFCCFIGGKYTIIIFLLFVVVMDIAAIKKINFMSKNNRNLEKNKETPKKENEIYTKNEQIENQKEAKKEEQIENKKEIILKEQNEDIVKDKTNNNYDFKSNDYFTFERNKNQESPKKSDSDTFTFNDTFVPNTDIINSKSNNLQNNK